MRFDARPWAAALVATVLVLSPTRARAHCDTMDGPVVKDARAAIEAKDVTPVLKWVKKEKEPEVRQVFAHTLAVRALGPQARDLADRYFFETLVRVHRDGEGAPYTGLKPAGTPVDPGILAADQALVTGDASGLTRVIAATVEKGVKTRLAHARETKAHAGESVEKGRAFVASYVDLTHYAEGLMAAAGKTGAHGGHETETAAAVEHH